MYIPTLTSTIEKGKSSEIATNEFLDIPHIPPPPHKITSILHFGTSYELADWLAKLLQFASDHLAQEHKDRDMIERAMIGALEPEEE